jgi:asparagine N-glycosylation enzyme membrane subunit Stt3
VWCVGGAAVQAFGYSASAFQVARIMSSVIGGFTYGVNDYIEIRGVELEGLDALLPSVISAVICFASAVAMLIWYDLTLPFQHGMQMNLGGLSARDQV